MNALVKQNDKRLSFWRARIIDIVCFHVKKGQLKGAYQYVIRAGKQTAESESDGARAAIIAHTRSNVSGGNFDSDCVLRIELVDV